MTVVAAMFVAQLLAVGGEAPGSAAHEGHDRTLGRQTAKKPARRRPAKSASEAAAEKARVTDAELARGIRCAEPGKCTIERALLEKLVADTNSLAGTVRIVPSIVDNKPDGFKIYAVRAGSFLARIGFENGDTIQTINGYDVSSPENALLAYSQLRNVDELAVRIVRRGAAQTLEYQIR
jgi:general secretion pathway protein C